MKYCTVHILRKKAPSIMNQYTNHDVFSPSLLLLRFLPATQSHPTGPHPKTLAPPHAEPRCSQDLRSSQADVHLSMALKFDCCAAIGRDQKPWCEILKEILMCESLVGSAKLEFWTFRLKKVPKTEYFPLKLRTVRVLIFVITQTTLQQTSPLLCISRKSRFFQTSIETHTV